MKPLKESDGSLIEPSLVDDIFLQIPEILRVHETFLSALSDRLLDWDSSQVIGDLFLEVFPQQAMTDIYTSFINNWGHAKDSIRKASAPSKTASAFNKFCENTSREHKGKLTLDALLIMPVQRIPRYELLLKELIKHTEPSHPDAAVLLEAQKQLHELALKIVDRPPPDFLSVIPVMKPRTGLLFTAASAVSLARQVWVCNSDGFVGQVCVLSLLPEPVITSCIGVCNARILCAETIPSFE